MNRDEMIKRMEDRTEKFESAPIEIEYITAAALCSIAGSAVFLGVILCHDRDNGFPVEEIGGVELAAEIEAARRGSQNRKSGPF